MTACFPRRKSQKSRSGSLSTGKMNLCPTPCGSCSTGKSETQSDTRNYNFPISVPPYCRIVAEAIVARYQLNVGYTTYLRSVNTGKEIRLEGRWSGIDCAEIKAKCTEHELDSNNITKIKTFNGVPHETVVL